MIQKSRANRVQKLALAPLSILATVLLLLAPFVPVHAQTQYVTANPGYINLGMTTSISVSAPVAGAYTVVVVSPSGTSSSQSLTFTAAAQAQNATFGISTSGFKALVNQVGTYNVFLEQGSQVVGSTSFYATNKLVVTMSVVTGGTCSYVAGITRGEKIFPRFSVSYASNGAVLTNNTAGINVNFTLPSKSVATANWDSGAKLFVGGVEPNWNYTNVGTWSPTATVSDAAGNVASYAYAGSPFTIAPAQLATSVQLTDSKTNQTVTSLYGGESVNIGATITYPKNAEPVTGFVGALDSSNRGGAVKAEIGYGYYNVTAGTFGGSAKNPGTLMGTVPMTYTGTNGTWTGQYTASSLPVLPAGMTYQVVVSSSDKASPPNTGFASLSVGTSTAPATTVTQTTTIPLGFQSISAISYGLMIVLFGVGLIIGILAVRRK